MRYLKLLIVVAIIFSANSCSNSTQTPKPKGYPRLYFPERAYTLFNSECPYSFEIPVYASMDKDPRYTIEPCWYNLDFKPFNATLHISYKHYSNQKEFNSLYDDNRNLAYKHTVKADEIQETEISRGDSLSGYLYELKGNTATSLNFYVCDNKEHFLRGALYFNAKTNNDSIAPISQFIQKDVMRLLETVRWK